MRRRKIFSVLIAAVPLLLAVAVRSADVDEKSSSNQTGTITQFLKSQLARVSANVKQSQQPKSESEKSNANNFDSKYKLLLSGNFPTALDLMNDSAEIDEPIEERDILSSDDDDDDFFKLKFPEKEGKSTGGLKFGSKAENQNIYKVPKSPKKFIAPRNATAVNERPNFFKHFTHLYDHFTWSFNDLNSSELSTICREDVQLYLNELNSEADWAVRSSDASGRFRGSFFFDNDFWIGSKDLCNEVNMDNANNRKIPRMQFFVVKLLVKFEKMKSERLLHVGQCLPDTCSVHDVSQMMSFDPASISFKQKNELIIVETRKVPGDFNILHYAKFYIFCFIIAIITLLVVVATIFERKLRIKGFQLEAAAAGEQCDDEKGRQKHELDYMNNNNNREEPDGATMNSIEETKQPPLRELNQMERILLCFSLETNMKTILNCDKDSKELSCIHGLRFLTILWTILVHTYLQLFGIGENRFNRKIAERTLIYRLVGNATFSVDTFFFISGFLVVLLYLKAEKSITSKEPSLSNGITKILLLIMYRFIRLTPVYLVVVVFTELSLKHVYNQSVFAPGLYDHFTCADHWWRNALYINNFYPLTEICMMWSWYLANDFQFYIVTIIVLIFTTRRFKLTIFATSFLLVGSLIFSMYISVSYKYQHKVAEPFESFDFLYDKPWQRFGPYAVGIFTAFVYHFNKSPKGLSPKLNVALWLASCLGLFVTVFGTPNGVLSVTATSFYVSFGHTLWGVWLMWILLSCSWGLAEPINKFLSFKALMPLSRLTYCVYLIHPTIMVITSYNSDTAFPLKHGLMATVFLGNVVLSYLAAFVLSLMFEAPVIRLLKVMFKK